MLKFARINNGYLITQENTGINIEMDIETAKSLARFLMIELNIIKAELNDGRKIEEVDKEFIKMLEIRRRTNYG